MYYQIHLYFTNIIDVGGYAKEPQITWQGAMWGALGFYNINVKTRENPPESMFINILHPSQNVINTLLCDHSDRV